MKIEFTKKQITIVALIATILMTLTIGFWSALFAVAYIYIYVVAFYMCKMALAPSIEEMEKMSPIVRKLTFLDQCETQSQVMKSFGVYSIIVFVIGLCILASRSFVEAIPFVLFMISFIVVQKRTKHF
tara:strand:- start:71 stop:454 length:384 start_codon:yes stop_codon:yes gene_type:complete